MIYVTGPDGTSATFGSNDIDYAEVLAMPSGIPGTQPSATANPTAPADVQIQLSGGYTLNSYAGVGFQENQVATMQVQVNGQADATLSDFHPQINWGDSASWTSGDLVYQGTNGSWADYIIKGSHVYQRADSNIPIVIYVTGPDGTSATFGSNDIDYAEVLAMPSGIPGTQPSATANPTAPADVQIQLSGGYTLNSYAGVGFQENQVATMQVQVNGQADATLSDFHPQINWGDSASWTSGDLVYQGTNGSWADYIIKGSHVYQKPGTNIPIVLYVTGPDGTSATFDSNDIDNADVAPNPNGMSLGNLTPTQWNLYEPGYDGTIAVSGGSGGYKDLEVNGLPTGLSATLSSSTVNGQQSGTITVSGTPTQSGTFTLQVSLEDGNGNPLNGADSLTINVPVSIPPSDAQPTLPCLCPSCGSLPVNQTPSGANGQDPGDEATSASGINVSTGGVENAIDGLVSDGFGTPFGQDLGWTNLTGYLALGGANGNGMVNADLPTIQPTPNGGVMVVTGAGTGLWFDPGPQSGTYTPKFFPQDTLRPDGSSGDFVLTDPEGDQTRFFGFESSLPLDQQGQFKSFTDPNGNVIAVTAVDSSGQIAEIQRSGTTNGMTSTESFLYSYITSGVNAGLLQNVTLRRQVNGGAWTTIRQAVYTYYDGTQPYGNAGDLQTEQIEDAAGHVLDTTYYRYYTPVDSGSTGYVHGLKYFFSPQSYDRLAAAVGNPLTATDAQVAPYADHYYEYDNQHRVTKEITQGAGDGSSGLGTYTYSYTTSANAQGYNSWQTRTVETLPDGNQNIYYTNFAGEVMLKVVKDLSDPADPTLQGQQWLTYDRYDGQGRLIEEAEPSAVTGYSNGYSDLLDFQNGTSPYLAHSSGLIYLYDYGTTTTATATTPGDVAGYSKDDKVQDGQAGTPILLDSTQYFAHTGGTATIYPVATQTVYRNTDGTGAETTSYSYTWYAGSNLEQSATVRQPVVSAVENGPGTADVSTTYFDTYGRPIWTRDGDGYLNYTAYDNATGAVTEQITDVNTKDTGEFSNLPAGWTTPAGGGLNLVTTDQVDGLGRPTEITDPNHNITYIVYDDPDHEVRTYQGWNAGTGTPTGPTEVVRDDLAHGYTETLTMSATPHLTGGVPDGTEPISNIQSLERDLTNPGGQLIEVDQYVSLNGVTYATTPYLGTAGTNYNPTYYGYDDSGDLQRVQDAVGTITDTLYDGLDRPVSTYVGTNDSTTNGQPWSPGNAASASNMVLVSRNQYDGNGVGDGNLTQTTLYPDSHAADNRVTQNVYDWRDRLVATKSGVQASEDTTTHRPIYYYDLDNLDEVTAVSQYDGDGVTLTGAKPSASLLRAYTVTNYDDQGRPYQTQQYDVNQATGALSASALTTNFYYDHRGDQVAESDPGGLWTKDQYDGAGRLVSESQTDGAGGTSWAAAGALTGDHVLTQTLTTYDADGDPILTTTKDRFDNDTSSDTGPLGNPTTGPKARVYYTASYYDAANRLTATVDVGTNGGVAYTRPGTVPARSDKTLVTSYTYSPAGWIQTTTDPRGIVTQDSYDLLGQLTREVDAYNASINNGQPTASNNQTTNYTYDGVGDTLTVTAVMPSGTPSQTTKYVYGVTTAGGSAINSNDLLAKLEYPDPTTGQASTLASNQESYQYNALGDEATFTDPNGTTHAYTYDVLGRQTSDAVTTLGAGVDGTVRRLTTAYDTGGRPYLFTSFNAASGGAIVNQVEDLYNGLGQLTGEYQQQNGAVNTATTPEVQFAYTELAGGQNNSRLTSMTYPNGRKLDYVYNAGLDSTISRVSALADDNRGTPGTILEAYSYLGLDTIVQRAHPEDGINLTYIQQPGDTHANTDGGDRYTGLDRFGRVIDQNWVNTKTGTSTDRFQYGYDRDGNVLYQADLVDAALSELYHANSTQSGDSNTAYDALGRLTGFARGVLSASGHNGTQLDTVASPSASQSWQLDALGNWSGVTTNGATTRRTFNAQNQATSATAPRRRRSTTTATRPAMPARRSSTTPGTAW